MCLTLFWNFYLLLLNSLSRHSASAMLLLLKNNLEKRCRKW